MQAYKMYIYKNFYMFLVVFKDLKIKSVTVIDIHGHNKLLLHSLTNKRGTNKRAFMSDT